jgi:putative DNA primase/helicase
MQWEETSRMANTVADDVLNQYSDEQKQVLRSEPLNAVGNCNRLRAFTGEDYKYIQETKQWMRYTSRWHIDYDKQWITKCYINAMEVTLLLATRENNNALRHFANGCLKTHVIEQDLKLASKMVSQSGFQFPISADKLDKDPMKLGTPNGCIDLSTGEPIETSKGEYITKSIRVDHDPKAHCKLWEDTFIPSICCGDVQLMLFLQKLAGYLLTASTKEEMLFFLFGGGRNGKGTYTGTLGYLLKDYFFTLPSSFLENKKFGSNNEAHASQLRGVRYALASETGQSRRWDMERVNDLTGGDTLPARALYQNTINIEPTWKLCIHGNSKPSVNSEGDGFWSRMALMPFDAKFDDPKVAIKDLKTELRKEENQQGILNWCLEGCLAWQFSGLEKPECVVKATKEFRSDSEILKDFYEQTCFFHEEAKVDRKDLFTAYKDYCNDMEIPPTRRFSVQNFYNKVRGRKDIVEVTIQGFPTFKGIGKVEDYPAFKRANNG